MIPWFGVEEAYGGRTPEYYNAFGFFFVGMFAANHNRKVILTLDSVGRLRVVFLARLAEVVGASAFTVTADC